MPFLLHRPGGDKPTQLTESDARRILKNDFPEEQMLRNVWTKLIRGEKVFVRPGQLQWVREGEAPPRSG